MMLRISLLLALLARSVADTDHGQAIIDWIRSEGGTFNDNLEIRHLDDDPFHPLGVFATAPIPKGQTLISVPKKCAIQVDSEEDVMCDLSHELYRELKSPENSKHAPFIKYLADIKPHRQMPSAWSKEGKQLLLELVNANDPVYSLPPIDLTGWSFEENCEKSPRDPLEAEAFFITFPRSVDGYLLPIFDLFSHRNGRYFNTVSGSLVDSLDLRGQVFLRAGRKIEAGEQLHISHNFCEDCGGRHEEYGTAEILRDHGVMEQYPQRWVFHGTSIAFDLEEDENDDLVLKWLEKPEKDDLPYLTVNLDRLVEFSDRLITRPAAIPTYEWNVIKQFHQSLVAAIENATAELENSESCEVNDDGSVTCFDKFDEMPVDDEDSDDSDDEEERYDPMTERDNFMAYHDHCCTKAKDWDFRDYAVLDEIESPYQKITFFTDLDDGDMCFDLDNIVQICSSYRPQYHEMAVHYAARYLDSVKRIAFIGGGDSMLLADSLKYPGIEKIIGLELDQRVVRYR